MAVNVEFDVPAHGANEEARALKEAAAAEAKLADMTKRFRSAAVPSFLAKEEHATAVNQPPFPVVNVIAEASPEGPGAPEAPSFVSKGSAKGQFSQQRSSLQKRWQGELEKQRALSAKMGLAAVFGKRAAAAAPSHAVLEAKTRAAAMTALKHDISGQVVRM